MVDPARLRLLKVLAVFTTGSFVGLVTFSHLLNYILKHYKNITLATIIGFIIGSLGVVWPWKTKVFQSLSDGSPKLNSKGEYIIENYQRYIPELTSETLIAIAYIIFGILILLGLEWYGEYTKRIRI